MKTDVLAERLLDINPNLELKIVPEYFRDEITTKVLEEGNFDYASDRIDTLSPKVFFIKACLDRKIPLVSSMGAGSKVDPTQVKVADIAESYNCKLAKYTRKYLHKFGIYKGVTAAVFSAEQRGEDAGLTMVGARNKKSAPEP